MKLYHYIFLLSFLFSERGAIHSIELLEYKTIEQIQIEIDDYLSDAPVDITALYNVSLYKVIYETIDG